MDLFLFANFFPYQKAEPFLINEIPFAKKFSGSVSVFTLYRNSEKPVTDTSGLTLLPAVFKSSQYKTQIFFKGVFNLAPFHFHVKELFSAGILFSPGKLYWFFTSLLLTRAVVASAAYKKMIREANSSENPVLYFYWGDNLAWIAPYVKKRIPHARIVVRLHGSDLYENMKADYAPLRNYVFQSADFICPVSENGKNYLVKKYPRFISKINTSRLGVLDNGAGPVPGSEIRVVSVSNIIALKRVDLIFEALQMLDIDLTWHHFGSGPLAEKLKEITENARSGLKIVLHGFVSNKEIIDFYKKTSVSCFINASTSEGVPVSIMEALSFGIPVIATDVGGTSELVTDTAGRLVTASVTAKELSVTLAHFLKLSQVESDKLRLAARTTFEELASAQKNYSRFYNKLAAND